ncbi:NAD-dependent epimerase [Gammaproteobacteria bacterium]|nr:NAD-dependent epimerase [Gammaproteobacteria bacterium]
MKILVTGAAGFIGYHLTQSLLSENHDVIGLDNLNDYYDVSLKRARIQNIQSSNFSLKIVDLSNKDDVDKIFNENNFDVVVNLAAQAGVRYSLTNPEKYIESNVIGFTNILEACRHNSISNLVYASSSSVYGMNTKTPFSENDPVDHPISLYAATKRSNELMAHTYSHLFNLPTTGLRFFTVYGPWGRPDMALFMFTKSILDGDAIEVFNNGEMIRDFTYIDDIVSGIKQSIYTPASSSENLDKEEIKPSNSTAPFKVFNLGNNKPVSLEDFINAIEIATNKKANKKYLPMQPGDVKKTYANINKAKNSLNFNPKTSINDGVKSFVEWYMQYYER